MIEQDFFAFMSAAFPTTPIAYPAIKFTPPKDGRWFELSVFRAQPLDGANTAFKPRLSGELQVMICQRTGKGIASMLQAFEDIATAMPNGTLFSEGLRTSQTPYMLSFIIDDDRVMLPVTVRFST